MIVSMNLKALANTRTFSTFSSVDEYLALSLNLVNEVRNAPQRLLDEFVEQQKLSNFLKMAAKAYIQSLRRSQK